MVVFGNGGAPPTIWLWPASTGRGSAFSKAYQRLFVARIEGNAGPRFYGGKTRASLSADASARLGARFPCPEGG